MKTKLGIALLLLAATAGASVLNWSEWVIDSTDVDVNITPEDLEGLPTERIHVAKVELPPVRIHPIPNLYGVRYVDIDDSKEYGELGDALTSLPGIVIVSRDDADMMIDYDESESRWSAELYRLKCQDDCASPVFVRVAIGRMEGEVVDGRRPMDDFTRKLLQLLLTSVPPPLQASP